MSAAMWRVKRRGGGWKGGVGGWEGGRLLVLFRQEVSFHKATVVRYRNEKIWTKRVGVCLSAACRVVVARSLHWNSVPENLFFFFFLYGYVVHTVSWGTFTLDMFVMIQINSGELALSLQTAFRGKLQFPPKLVKFWTWGRVTDVRFVTV